MRLSPDPNFLLSYKGYCLFEQRGMGALSSCLHDRNEGTEGGGERAFTIKEAGTWIIADRQALDGKGALDFLILSLQQDTILIIC